MGRGTCFVVLGLLVELPILTRPVRPPVMARLWRPGVGKTKVELAASMIRMLSACHSRRPLHVVAEAAYHGGLLRDLPQNTTFTTRLPASAVLHDLAPPRTGCRSRPRLKGDRLSTAADLAAQLPERQTVVERYRRRETAQVGERHCMWYGSMPTRVLRLLVVREIGGYLRP